MTIYQFDINDRPFQAIKNGTKKVEVRTNTPQLEIDFFSIKAGDKIALENNATKEKLTVLVLKTVQ